MDDLMDNFPCSAPCLSDSITECSAFKGCKSILLIPPGKGYEIYSRAVK